MIWIHFRLIGLFFKTDEVHKSEFQLRGKKKTRQKNDSRLRNELLGFKNRSYI